MTNNEIWNRIAYVLDKYKYEHEPKIIHPVFYEAVILRDLKWPESRTDNETPVQMGREKRIDILLTSNSGNPLVAIEIKRADANDSQKEMVGQIRSYMLNSRPQMEFGILIKDKIYVFYDSNKGADLETLDDAVLTIPFECNSPEGEKFVELFRFDNFNLETLTSFCEKRKAEITDAKNKQRDIQNLTKTLLSKDGTNIIREAITSYLISSNYTHEVISEVLGNLCININSKHPEYIQQQIPNHLTNHLSQRTIGNCKVKWIFVPSLEKFLEHFYNNGSGYIHWRLKGNTINHFKSDKWHNKNNTITALNIKGNIISRPFWREHKHEIAEVIVSIYDDPTIIS